VGFGKWVSHLSFVLPHLMQIYLTSAITRLFVPIIPPIGRENFHLCQHSNPNSIKAPRSIEVFTAGVMLVLEGF